MPIVKFKPKYKLDIIEMYAQGYSLGSIASALGITYRSLRHWVIKYDLQSAMDKAKEEYNKQLIDEGLSKLAKGAEDTVETEKSIYYREAKKKYYDDEGNLIEESYIQPVERTTTRKIKAPDSKAIEILARKYAKEFDNKAEERELTANILEGFTMRQLQEANKNNPIDAGVIMDAEFKELSNED